MCYKHFLSSCNFLILVLILFIPNVAYTMTAQDVYREGVESARNGDYQAARKNFEIAKQAGVISPALYYNLGVSYYRLGLYEKAFTSFFVLTEHEKLADVAAYNLGLTLEKQKRYKQAIQWYTRVLSISTNPSLLEFSRHAIRHLATLSTLSTPPKQAQRASRTKRLDNFNGRLSTKFYLNNNVNRENDEINEQLGKGLEVDLTANGFLFGHRSNGLKLSSRIYRLKYQPDLYDATTTPKKNTENFNYDITLISASYYIRRYAWSHRLIGSAANVKSGDADYKNETGYELRSHRKFFGLVKLHFRYRYREIVASAPFTDETGTQMRYRLGVQLSNFRKNKIGKKIYLYYRFEENSRKGVNFSPERKLFRFLISAPVGKKTKIKFSFEYRFSNYGRYETLDSASNLVAGVRKDKRTKLRLELDYKFSKDLHLLLGGINTQNSSSFSQNSSTAGNVTRRPSYDQVNFYTGLRWYY